MSFEALRLAAAFSPGADLWIAAEPAKSWVGRRLDWRLNFMISRAWERPRAETSAELLEISTRAEFEVPEIPRRSDSGLLIESSRHLPNRAVLVLAWKDDAAAWAREARRAWTTLGRPGVRIFLPVGLSHASFELEWSRAADSDRGDALEGGSRKGASGPQQTASETDLLAERGSGHG